MSYSLHTLGNERFGARCPCAPRSRTSPVRFLFLRPVVPYFNSFSTLTTQCRNIAYTHPYYHPLRGPRTPVHPGITEALQLRLLHCAPMSKASLADSSTNGWGHARDGSKAAPECPSSCLRDGRSWRSVIFFVKVTAGCIIHCSSPRVMC